ncbi:hypothetical protein FA13DRAFT_1727331 [Coprinellus micaceus]|uniref:BTB domain-containing protein n=1 Tax=Coprinellus micaceus TaxID=71717 RepID=A0A4Y7TTP7_COPMI|nr:hypothetical protein FA13DRAFT_1727331 [Coprinellus micaceus]
MANTPQRGRFFYECVVFLAENTLHSVPRYYLEEHSQFFKDMFSLPQGVNGEGKTEQNPIRLSGCTNAEFESILEEILPRVNPRDKALQSHGKERWEGVLKLATMWEMRIIRERAISALTNLKLPPMEMVSLGKRFRVPNWLVDGCVALIVGQGRPDLDTLAASLGWEMAARIAWVARGDVKEGSVHIPKKSWSCPSCDGRVDGTGAQNVSPDYSHSGYGMYHQPTATSDWACKSCRKSINSIKCPVSILGAPSKPDVVRKVKDMFAGELRAME